MKVLYLTDDGAMDPLGQSQILPYLVGLSSLGPRITLLTFEKKEKLRNKKAVTNLDKNLKNKGINWVILRYHQKPKILAKFFDMVTALFRAIVITRKEDIDFIHARSYIPAIIAYIVKKLTGTRYIFDMRAFWADERVDAGMWPRNYWLYKVIKKLERLLLLNSDRIVVLAHQAKGIVQNLDYMKDKHIRIDVIPTCTDIEKFNIQKKSEDILNSLDIKNRFILVYLGSIGTWYMLNEMIYFFKALKGKVKNSFFLFLANTEKEAIVQVMKEYKIAENDFAVVSISHEDVPRWLSVADASIIFRKPSFARKSSCPTKFGEALACGIPVIVNSEVGDTSAIVKSNRAGVIIDSLTHDSFQKAIDELSVLSEDRAGLRARCREAAAKNLALADGIDSFSRIYKDLGRGRRAE